MDNKSKDDSMKMQIKHSFKNLPYEYVEHDLEGIDELEDTGKLEKNDERKCCNLCNLQ